MRRARPWCELHDVADASATDAIRGRPEHGRGDAAASAAGLRRPDDGGASDTVWETLERAVRFRDDQNMVVATQRRVTRCGRRFPGGTRFRDDQNTVLGDTVGSATGGRPECSSEPRSTGAMKSRGQRARSLTPLTLSHSALLASALLKSAQRRRHPRHDATVSERLGYISPLHTCIFPVLTSPIHGTSTSYLAEMCTVPTA